MPSTCLVDIDLIHANPANVRTGGLGDLEDLAASIRVHGLLQPLVIQPHPDKPGHYQLLAGHRRHAAARLAGRFEVAAIVRHGATDDRKQLVLMVVENCQRRDLTPLEKAEAVEELLRRGYTQAQIVKETGLSASTISGYRALLELDPSSRDRVRRGVLTTGQAVTAVRATRRPGTRRRASAPAASLAWDPDHLADTHALAAAARRRCHSNSHSMRTQVGQVACGRCWEEVIREDERQRVLSNPAVTVG